MDESWLPELPPATDEQRAVALALHDHGRVMVEAAPGAGKTFTALYLAVCARKLGWTDRKHPTLVLTFSRAARGQVEEQIEQFVASGWLTEDDRQSIEISNFHSFFLNLLRRRAGFWGCSTSLVSFASSRRNSGIERLVSSFKGGKKAKEYLQDELNSALGLCRFSVQELLGHDPVSTPRLHQEGLQMAKNRLRSGELLFDDFGPLILQLLECSSALLEWLRLKYPLLIVDEFQDTDVIQWTVLDCLSPQYVAIFYDRFQMIYRWRGASPDRPMQAIERFAIPTSARLELKQIQRGDAGADRKQFIQDLRKDGLHGEFISRKRHDWLRLVSLSESQFPIRSQDRCRNAIRWYVKPVEGKTTAVLCQTNDWARFLAQGLRKTTEKYRGTPCSVIGGEDDPLERAQGRLAELTRVTCEVELRKWLGHLLDDALDGVYEICNEAPHFHKRFAITPVRVLSGNQPQDVQAVVRRLNHELGQVVPTAQSVHRALGTVIELASVLGKLRGQPRWDYLAELRRIRGCMRGVGDKHIAELALELEARMWHLRESSSRVSPKGLNILTVYQSKGREFDRVVIPWLAADGEDHSAYDPSNDDDLRLLYVAMTRCKKELIIIFPAEKPSPILGKWKLL